MSKRTTTTEISDKSIDSVRLPSIPGAFGAVLVVHSQRWTNGYPQASLIVDPSGLLHFCTQLRMKIVHNFIFEWINVDLYNLVEGVRGIFPPLKNFDFGLPNGNKTISQWSAKGMQHMPKVNRATLQRVAPAGCEFWDGKYFFNVAAAKSHNAKIIAMTTQLKLFLNSFIQLFLCIFDKEPKLA